MSLLFEEMILTAIDILNHAENAEIRLRYQWVKFYPQLRKSRGIKSHTYETAMSRPFLREREDEPPFPYDLEDFDEVDIEALLKEINFESPSSM